MKSKKIIAALLALTFAAGGAALPVAGVVDIGVISAAADGVKDYEYSETDDGTIVIDKYNGTAKSIEIPEEIDGKPVVGIGEKAFYEKNNITNVVIPEGVTEIGERAFDNCKMLMEVILPETLKTISDYAFVDCYNLSNVYLTDSIETIGKAAFKNCYSLKSANIPESVQSIGAEAYRSCYGLEEITIPSSLTEISDHMFYECKSMKSIIIPDSVVSIGKYAFYRCISLEKAVIPESVEEIGLFAFSKGTSQGLKIYCFPDSVAQNYAIQEGISYGYMPEYVPELSYEKGNGCVKLSWSAVENAEKYAVYGYNDGLWKKFAEVEGTSYVLKNLKEGNEYEVAVSAFVNDKEIFDKSNSIKVTPAEKVEESKYPKPEAIVYNEEFHQFRVKWSAVSNAQQYGIAVKLAGKWKVQAYTDAKTTYFTSPKLKAGSKYDMVICAKVDGKWDTSNLAGRAFTVTIK